MMLGHNQGMIIGFSVSSLMEDGLGIVVKYEQSWIWNTEEIIVHFSWHDDHTVWVLILIAVVLIAVVLNAVAAAASTSAAVSFDGIDVNSCTITTTLIILLFTAGILRTIGHDVININRAIIVVIITVVDIVVAFF